MTINFYLRRDSYGDFSNFSRHPITVDGREYFTSEHYYQAMKFPHDPAHMKRVMDEPQPRISKEIAWEQKPREDWDEVKDEIMLTALRAKLAQYPQIKQMLLDTEDEELVEDSPVDYYWGCGEDGSGTNMLGKQLMELREELRTLNTKIVG